MVTNAKEYFPRNSQMYEDAERVRKALSNYMVKNNPAYQKKGYTAVPTPLPPDNPQDADGDDNEEDAEGEEEEEQADGEQSDVDGEGEPEDNEEDIEEVVIPKRRGPGRPPKNPILHAKKMAAKAAKQEKADSQYENVPYKGLNFQQAQEKLVEELIRKREEE